MTQQLDPIDDVASAASSANSTVEDLKQAKSKLLNESFQLTGDLTRVAAQKSTLRLEKNRLQRDLQNGEASVLSATTTSSSGTSSFGTVDNRIREIDNQITSLDVKEKSIRETLNQSLTRTKEIENQLELQEVAPGRVVSSPENSQAENLPPAAQTFPVAPQGQQPVNPSSLPQPNVSPGSTGEGLTTPSVISTDTFDVSAGIADFQSPPTAPISTPPTQDLDQIESTLAAARDQSSVAIASPPNVGDEAIAAIPTSRPRPSFVPQGGANVNTPTTTAAPNQGAAGSTSQVRVEGRDDNINNSNPDWRFKISLAPGSKYFYNEATASDILRPLKDTNGVIFPYTPQINVTYGAAYEPVDLTHSNYRSYNYKNSYVDAVTITGDFTAQDTFEANYVLAAIHFFRSVTKMWYGQDQTPIRGTPPPLCYLSGHGAYAFDLHPVVITSFTLNYPTDVDYINASQRPVSRGNQLIEYNKPTVGRVISPLERLKNAGLAFGGKKNNPANTKNDLSSNSYSNVDNSEITRIPTKLQITLTALPIVSRNTISNNFSLNDYATGKLLRGRLSYRRNGGGIW